MLCVYCGVPSVKSTCESCADSIMRRVEEILIDKGFKLAKPTYTTLDAIGVEASGRAIALAPYFTSIEGIKL